MDQSAARQKISINYIEFKVKDVVQSKRFYQNLGWTFTDFGPEYCEFDSGEIKVALPNLMMCKVLVGH